MLTVAGAVAALALAAVFVVAAVAKLRDRSAAAADMAALGLPGASLLGRAVPVIELVVAAALVIVPGWGGVLAFAMLAAFTAVLVPVVRSGRVVPCACFGAASRKPISFRHLVRNGVLLAVAALAATFDGTLLEVG